MSYLRWDAYFPDFLAGFSGKMGVSRDRKRVPKPKLKIAQRQTFRAKGYLEIVL